MPPIAPILADGSVAVCTIAVVAGALLQRRITTACESHPLTTAVAALLVLRVALVAAFSLVFGSTSNNVTYETIAWTVSFTTTSDSPPLSLLDITTLAFALVTRGVRPFCIRGLTFFAAAVVAIVSVVHSVLVTLHTVDDHSSMAQRGHVIARALTMETSSHAVHVANATPNTATFFAVGSNMTSALPPTHTFIESRDWGMASVTAALYGGPSQVTVKGAAPIYDGSSSGGAELPLSLWRVMVVCWSRTALLILFFAFLVGRSLVFQHAQRLFKLTAAIASGEEEASIDATLTLPPEVSTRRAIADVKDCFEGTVMATLWRRWRGTFSFWSAVYLAVQMISFATPLLLRILVDELTKSDDSDSPANVNTPTNTSDDGWSSSVGTGGDQRSKSSPDLRVVTVCLLGMIASAVVTTFLRAHYTLTLQGVAVHCRGLLSCAVFRRVLQQKAVTASSAAGATTNAEDCGDSEQPVSSGLAPTAAAAINHDDDDDGEAVALNADHRHLPSPSSPADDVDGARSRKDQDAGRASVDRAYGAVATHVTVDVFRIADQIPNFNDLWALPLQAALALGLLYLQVSFAFLGGLALAVLLVPVNVYLAKKIGAVNGKLMKANDERVTRLDESLSNIVAVKSTGDTARIVEWIMQPRREYFKQLTWLKLLDAWCVFFWATTPIFVSVVTFMTYSWVMGRELTAGRAVAALALFANLIAPLNAYPWVVNGATEAFVSQRRLTAFLQDLKVESPWAVGDTAGQSRGEHWPRPQSPRHSGTQPRLSNASNPPFPTPEPEHSARSSGVPSPLLGGTRNSTGVHGPHAVSVTAVMPLPRGVRPRGAPSSALHFEGFTIAPGHVTVVAGGSGAGKSLALLALLGEVDGGGASVLGHPVAYLPQQPLLVRGSVKENIIFDRLFDPAALDEAVRRACLTRDCTLWPDGLETSVGEDGKALSGGQRTRVNLARALYGALLPPPQDMLHQSARSSRSAVVDVYGSLEHSPSLSSPPQPGALFPPAPQGTGCRYLVLDDPFASLDAATTRFILRSAVFGLAAERNIAVIVATHHHELFSSGPPQPAPCNVFEVAQGRLALIASVEPSSVAGLIEAPTLPACEGDEALIAVEAGSIEARAKESDLGHVDSGDSAPAATGGLQQTDLKHSGTVAVQAARSYTAHVGVLFSVAVVASLVLMQAVRNGNDCFVAWWTTSGDSLDFFIKGLAVFAAGNACFALTRSFAFAFAGLRAARATHDQLLDSVFAASMAFFHDVSAAAVVNRLSQDVYNVDDPFPFTLNIVMAQLFLLIGAIAVIFVNSSPFVLLVIPPVAVAFFFLQRPYRKATRELKRVESATRTPILDVVKMFCDGAASLRAEGRASLERREAQAVLSLDGLQRSNWSLSVLGAWFGLRLQLIGAAILACVAVAVLVIVAVADGGTSSVSAASLGLAVAYVGPLSGNLSALLGSFTELEKLMISVERIDDYCGAEPEAQALHLQDTVDASYQGTIHQPGRGAVFPLPGEGEGIAAPGASYNNANVWPSQGTIEIANCRVVFGAHVALSIPTLRINAGEKVAVVGRTGAGKSTFVNALLGLVSPQAVDGAAPCRLVVDGCELFAPLPEAALHGGCASNNASSHGLQTLPRADHAATTATPLLSAHNDQHGEQSTGGGKPMQTKTRTVSTGDPLGVDVLRRAAAVLPQKPFVWHGTVASNVDPDGAMTAAGIDAALAFVGLTMPCEDDASDEHALSAKTVLDEHGKNISLGEQHLLAFARFWATRPNPVVTLMDEPGSAVGHEACDRLMRCVLRRAGTCVVVTHSLRTIGEYDRVLVLDGGRVVEDGAPSALLSDSASRLSQLAAA